MTPDVSKCTVRCKRCLPDRHRFPERGAVDLALRGDAEGLICKGRRGISFCKEKGQKRMKRGQKGCVV